MSTLAEVDTLIENVKKESDILAKVKLLAGVIHDNDLRIKDVAAKLGVKSAYVCHLLRLQRLPEVIVDGYYSKDITLSHLFIISRLKDKTKMMEVYEKVLGESLSVKKTEELIRDILYGITTEGDYLSPEEKNVFIDKIATQKKNLSLTIIQTRIKSKLIVEIKGNLENTSREIRELMKNLEAWQ